MALDPRIDAFGEALLGQAARCTRDIAITLFSPMGMLSHTRWSYLTAECGITHEYGQPPFGFWSFCSSPIFRQWGTS